MPLCLSACRAFDRNQGREERGRMTRCRAARRNRGIRTSGRCRPVWQWRSRKHQHAEWVDHHLFGFARTDQDGAVEGHVTNSRTDSTGVRDTPQRRKVMDFLLVIHPAEEGGYWAEIPEVEG